MTTEPAAQQSPESPKFNPWLFVPLLYFMQAIPVTIVQEVATVFYKDLGIANEPITRWTSLISLPWSMQLLLGPLVDLNSTKRKWILGGQFLIGIGLAATAFALAVPYAFEITLVILATTAITSALCNIATDGFYIISMSKDLQAKFVGIQSTCYRLGRLFCTGILLLFVGLMTRVPSLPVTTQTGSFVLKKDGALSLSKEVHLTAKDGCITDQGGGVLQPEIKTPNGVYGISVTTDGKVMTKTVTGDQETGQLMVTTSQGSPSEMPAVTAASVSAQEGVQGMNPVLAWTIVLAAAAGIYLLGHLANRVTLPRPAEDESAVQEPGESRRNLHRTFVLIALGMGGYFFLNSIVRLTAHAIWSFKDGTIPTGDKMEGLQGWMLRGEGKFVGFETGLTAFQAELVQLVVCAIVIAVALNLTKRLIRGTQMADAMISYVRQDGFPAILGFILFYRFGEAMVSKMSPLFLKDAIDKGGLAIANDQLGLIKGVAGVIGIVVGGLAGGYVVSKLGLRRAFWPLAFAMHVPNLLYVWASAGVRPPMWSLYVIDFVDQFGYGFGFAGYMVYLMWVAQRGHFKTTHYAIGTGMGALCIAVAGIVSGIVQSNFGYHKFFISVIFMTIPGMLMLLFIPLDETHKKIKATVE